MTQAAILAASGSPGTTTGFKNRIINGGMVIDQRNAGNVVTPTGNQYLLDRWQAGANVASKYSVQQVALGGALPAFPYAMKVLSLSAYSVAATDVTFIQQRIEGFNVADLGWGTASAKSITISAWVYSSLTGTFGGVVQNRDANRSYPFTYSIPVAATWTQISVTIPGDTSGTWYTNNDTGIRINFGLGVGSTYSGTAGAWAAAEYYGATGAVSVVGTNGATWYITGVQLEAGTTATNFDFRSIGTELQLCQRYFQLNAGFPNWYNNSVQAQGICSFKVTMRANPSVGQIGLISITQTGVADFTQSSTSSGVAIVSGNRVTTEGCSVYINNLSGLPTGAGLWHIASSGALTFSAEL